MPSFLKKSSVGESEPGSSLKCCSARVRTSWVVFSIVGMTSINLAFLGREEKFMKGCSLKWRQGQWGRLRGRPLQNPEKIRDQRREHRWSLRLVGHRASVFNEFFQSGHNSWAGEEFAEDFDFVTKLFVGNRLDESFGGRAGGCVEFGDLSGGAAGDLESFAFGDELRH